MYNEAEWREYSLKHAQTVVNDVSPVKFNDLEEKIRAMYFLLNLPQPKHTIIVRNPLEMFALQLYIEGKVEAYPQLDYLWQYYGDQIEQLPKNPTPMTPELVEYALALAWMVEDIVKDQLGEFDDDFLQQLLSSQRQSEILAEYLKPSLSMQMIMRIVIWLTAILGHNQTGDNRYKTLTEVVDFENEAATGIKLDSLEDNVFNFVKRIEDVVEEVLKTGYYNAGGHKVALEGWPKLTNNEDFANIAFNAGRWAVWVSDFKYLCEVFNFSHPIIDALVDIAESSHYWMAYGDPDGDNGYLILCDSPSVCKIDGPNSDRHNETGPAFQWEGFELYYWNNTLIPPWFIENKLNGTLSSKDVTKESNQEMRRILMQIYGWRNWIHDEGAKVIHEDVINGSPYTLYETRNENNENVHILKCIDGSLKNGNYQEYYLVTHRDMNTCLESVANSYGLTPEQYTAALFRT